MRIKKFKHLKSILIIMIFMSALGLWQNTMACTGIMLRNADSSIVHGRTLEFGIPVESSLLVVPRGYEFIGKTPLGAGLRYSAKNAAVGVFTFKDVVIADGMNEKGLAAGAFYFPTYAKYADISDQNKSKALSPLDFTNWLLTQFDNVRDVKQALEKGAAIIAPTVLEGWGPVAPPLHYVVYDASGACITIEPIDGKLEIQDNPIGVFTNSPNFGWHLTNLRNYIALNPLNVPFLEIEGLKLQQFGQGNGMLGLPGDFTPPSRFIRAAFFASTAIPSTNADLGIQNIFHLLNNFDIPLGIARDKEGKATYSDSTQITVARDPKSLRYYYKTYDDQTIRMVDLKKFDLDSKVIRKLGTKGGQFIIDMSSELK